MGANISQNKAQVGYPNPSQCHKGRTCGSGTIQPVDWMGQSFDSGVWSIPIFNDCPSITGSKTTYGAEPVNEKTIFGNSEDATANAHFLMPNGKIVSVVMEKVKNSQVAQFTATFSTMKKGNAVLKTYVGTLRGNKFHYRLVKANAN